jgi:hypothetical protein
MSEGITGFICGPRRDHECNVDGPEICGGQDDDDVGIAWRDIATPENKKRAQWGSVSCSICGLTSMERGMWEGI